MLVVVSWSPGVPPATDRKHWTNWTAYRKNIFNIHDLSFIFTSFFRNCFLWTFSCDDLYLLCLHQCFLRVMKTVNLKYLFDFSGCIPLSIEVGIFFPKDICFKKLAFVFFSCFDLFWAFWHILQKSQSVPYLELKT